MEKQILLTPEALADLMAQAYHDGWESGHAGEPEPVLDDTYLEYLEGTEYIDDPEATRH